MSFLPSSHPLEMKVVMVAVMNSSGSVITTPERIKKGQPTIPEMLGKWDRNSAGFWSLHTALLLGLSGTKNGPFEILTFGFKPADCRVVLQGQVLGVTLYDDLERKRKLAAVYASGEGCLWQITCQRELLTPAAVYFIPMPNGVNPKNFNHPLGHDFGLKDFCEPKAGPVETEAEKASEPEQSKATTLTSTDLVKLGKKPLKLGGEKEHLASFCCQKLIPGWVEEAFVAGSQLGLLEVGVRDHFDPSLVAGWRKELDQAMMCLLAFGEEFLPKTDIPAKFPQAQYPHHKPKYCGKKLVPQLVQTLVQAAKVLEALPDDMKPLMKDSEEMNLAGKVSAAVAGIHKFIPLLGL